MQFRPKVMREAGWVEGTLLGLNGCQDTVTLALAQCPRGPDNPHTLRRLQRELLYDDADRHPWGPRSWGQGQELEVARCFAPLLRWVRSWWVATGGRELAQEPLVLALDPTSKQDDTVALVIRVVYRQHAIPVAWHIAGAQARESWIDIFCRLLRLLAPAVPATVPVHVLCDQGLCSRDLWAKIVALGCPLGRHPCLPYPPHVTFQPQDQSQRVPVRSLITGPGDLCRPGLPHGASGQHFNRVAGLRSGAALGAADRHAGGADGTQLVCLPQLD